MARVTVEDCIDKVTSRFELVMVAAQRARKIGTGAALTIDRDNDKNPVVALREIADETIDIGGLREELVRNHQRIIASDEDDDDEDVIEVMDGEQEWGAMADQAGELTSDMSAESSSDLSSFEDEEESSAAQPQAAPDGNLSQAPTEEAGNPTLEDLAGEKGGF